MNYPHQPVNFAFARRSGGFAERSLFPGTIQFPGICRIQYFKGVRNLPGELPCWVEYFPGRDSIAGIIPGPVY